MTKADLAQKLGDAVGGSKADGDKAVNALVDTVTEALQSGEDVAITGFGTFSISARKARTGVNPQNPSQKIQIPAMNVPKFKAGKALKEAVR
jgi:DNA-binding protein HU-beta